MTVRVPVVYRKKTLWEGSVHVQVELVSCGVHPTSAHYFRSLLMCCLPQLSRVKISQIDDFSLIRRNT